MALLSKVLLTDLKFDGTIGVSKVCEKRADGFSDLEIDGTVLDLHHNVVVELTIELTEELNSSVSTVSLPVGPVKLVVDESSEHDDSSMRLESFGEHVGTIGQCAFADVSYR